MSEQYTARVDAPRDDASFIPEGHSGYSDNITHVDFREHPSNRDKMQRIGQVVTGFWQTEEGRGAIAHVPIDSVADPDGSVTVKMFQYQQGYTNPRYGIPHPNGWSGPETLSILCAKWNASPANEQSRIKTWYLQPRNIIYAVKDIQSKEHSGSAYAERTAIEHDMWGND